MTEPRYSYSVMDTFKSCPLKYFHRYIANLEPRDAASSSHHLAWGAAFHAGLEYYYKCLQLSPVGELNTYAAIIPMRDIFATGYPYQLDSLDKAKTQENGKLALSAYVRRWAEEDRKWKILEIESPGAIEPLASGLNELHTDLIVENLEHGGIYVVDHKTTSKPLGSWYWDRYDPNSQITHYIDYCQEKYGSCEGFIINAISLQWLDEKKSNDANNVKWFAMDDPNMGWLNYSHHEEREYRGGPLGKKGPRMVAWGLTVGFERQVFQRSKGQLIQERASTSIWINRITELSEERCGRCRHYKANHLGGKEGETKCFLYPCECTEYEVAETVWPFNTNSCYSCEYRGGEIGGICKPGHVWPQDREIISLSYRQVCRAVIELPCPQCVGTGVDPEFRRLLAQGILEGRMVYWPDENDETREGYWSVLLERCSKCEGTGKVSGPRCQLDLNHASNCSPVAQVDSGEMEIEVNV